MKLEGDNSEGIILICKVTRNKPSAEGGVEQGSETPQERPRNLGCLCLGAAPSSALRPRHPHLGL